MRELHFLSQMERGSPPTFVPFKANFIFQGFCSCSARPYIHAVHGITFYLWALHHVLCFCIWCIAWLNWLPFYSDHGFPLYPGWWTPCSLLFVSLFQWSIHRERPPPRLRFGSIIRSKLSFLALTCFARASTLLVIRHLPYFTGSHGVLFWGYHSLKSQYPSCESLSWLYVPFNQFINVDSDPDKVIQRRQTWLLS